MKNLTVLLSLLLAIALTFSCGNNDQQTENEDSTNVDESQTSTNESASEDLLTVTAKFESAFSLEGDADLYFVKKDGSKIVFYRNYMGGKEPEIKYNLIGEDGASANPDLVGQTFEIKYKLNPKSKISVVTGEYEPCFQILSLEKK